MPPNISEHVVLLVHGIRDIARWQNEIRATLESEGFTVQPTNYGRMNLIEFLLPISYFRKIAINTVWKQIEYAKKLHPEANFSIIAHSFGTYIVANILRNDFNLSINRVIFCGSVVKYGFPFEQVNERFNAPILNDVGTYDPWPALAESITTDYGSAGTYGFFRPGVRDRFHNGAGHGYFLESTFCKKYWVPFLKDGKYVEGESNAQSPPFWVRLLSIFKIKYFLMLAATLAALAYFVCITNSFDNILSCRACSQVEINRLIAAGQDAYNDGNFGSVKRVVGKLRACERNHYAADFYEGVALFYDGNFGEAARSFHKSLQGKPDSQGIANNYAMAMVEEAILRKPVDISNLRKAMSLVQQDTSESDTKSYRVARIAFFLQNYTLALRKLASVPTDYRKGYGVGKARILEGAIYIILHSREINGELKQELLDKAKENFMAGYRMNELLWSGIIFKNNDLRSEQFRQIIEVYGEKPREWLE